MIQTSKHLAYILKIPAKELQVIIDNIDKYYYKKVELKLHKDGTPKMKNGLQQKRVLYPSVNRLKIVQKRILTNILSQITMPDYAYGAIKGRDNVQNAKKHQGKKFIFTTDLRSFYPSVSNRKVFEMFRILNFSHTVSRLLTQLTTYKGQLPQGAPTSPAIANLVFMKTGNILQTFALKNQLTFSSYIDDLTFSSPFNFKEKTGSIINAILHDNFKISHDKTNYKTKNPVVTGLTVNNNSLSLPNSFKEKLQNLEGKSIEQVNGLMLYANKVAKSNLRKYEKLNLIGKV